MKQHRWFSMVLALIMVFSLCTSAFAADPKQATEGKRLFSSLENPKADVLPSRLNGLYKPGDQVRAIVLTKSEPTAEYRESVQGLLDTAEKLMEEHAAVKARMEQLAIDFIVNFEYTALLNGMSVTLDYADLKAVASIPGVTDVIIATEYRLPEPEPNASSAANMINAVWLNDKISADGSGKVVAVLDTGITVGHEAFKVYDGMLQTPAISKADMLKAVLKLGHGAYHSKKIPYQYDYADRDLNAADDLSGHGSHVAGIAAGYVATGEGEVTFRGSAPDAQILAMKIFSSQQETTSSDIYLAALEDAYKLGADVINMSIGAACGFVEDDESALNDRIYERLENAGIICCVSAGNEASIAENSQNRAGAGYLTTDCVDYGTLGSPASYNGNVAVAAAENVEYPAYQITVGEESYSYLDSDGTAFIDKFAGQDPEYVMVPNLGAAEDYADLDVQGKIAVISRGEITFEEKVGFAASAGAAAAVIYDDREGALISMAIDTKTIPAVFISQEAGAALQAQEVKTFHVNAEMTIIENPEARRIADFSSWGPTNDLQIKPTITGIGGNLNSVASGTENGYVVMSGTSMSAPNVTGGYASLLDAICRDNPNLSKTEAAAIARNRTLSSARTLTAYDGVPFSPRRQGAGCLDLQAAYRTTLTIADPLAELGDDPARSGVYTVRASVQNTADVTRTYAIRTDVLTDAIEEVQDAGVYNSLKPLALVKGTDYTLSAPETVTLAPGETRQIDVTITLTSSFKANRLDANFENGAFIDGYVFFDSTESGESQHVTFLAFYGDWASAPVLETHDWRDLMSLTPDQLSDWVSYVDWEVNTIPGESYLVDGENNPVVYAGDSPFGYPEGGVYSDARIAVSTNANQAYSTRLLVVPITLRNARNLIMIARDAETGKIYATDNAQYCRKTFYSAQGWTVSAWFQFEGKDTYSGKNAVNIADNTKVVLEFYADLPYGEDVLGSMTPEQIVQNGAQYLGYSVPCVVDGEAPVIESCSYDYRTGDVTVVVRDNQYLAGVYAVDKDGNELAESQAFADAKPGESHTVTLHVGEQSSFYVGAMDYATNEYNTLVKQQIEITKQPQDAFAKRGDNVQFNVEASGDGLTYQWQYQTAHTSVWMNSLLNGAKTDTITVQATALRNGQKYRCVLKDALGQTLTSDPATLTIVTAPKITQHPQNATVSGGENAQFKVVAEGGGLSYQWQYRTAGTSTWKDSALPGAQTDTITVTGMAHRNGQQYRCVVTNAAGTATSDAATLTVNIPLKITSQPKNTTVALDAVASFTVKANGVGLKYQWQYKTAGTSLWKNSALPGANTNTVRIVGEKHRNGQEYRCIITDVNGATVTSNPAKLTVSASKLIIVTQPKSAAASNGSTASFTVVASGTNMRYQWQYKMANGASWYNCTAATAGYNTANLKVSAEPKRDGYQYRCVITDGAGNQIVSNAVKLTVK